MTVAIDMVSANQSGRIDSKARALLSDKGNKAAYGDDLGVEMASS